jgi:uncharacterized protein YutE (UPF0331/DUF86 family)
LKELSSEGFEKFELNYKDMMAAKHALQEAIEACLYIANHIISTKGFRKPELEIY